MDALPADVPVDLSDRLDFARFVEERRPALLRTARAITRDAHSAEDLLQVVLVKVARRWADIREPGARDAYVRRALMNQYATWSRQQWRRRELPTADLPERGPADPTPRRGDQLELWPLVAALPPRQRAAVVLRYYEGMTEAEAAAALRCSRGTVKSNTSRGIATLRRWALASDQLDLAG